MAKLYFRYGAMCSAKTLNLLAVAHNYEQQGKIVLVWKPAIGARFGEQAVASRAGLTRVADLCITPETSLFDHIPALTACILVDEAQFLEESAIESLRMIAHKKDIPVLCYGLRTDFRSRLFTGSQRLMELADTIEEIKTTCHFCNRKATMNLRHYNGKATVKGDSVMLGTEELYYPACFSCYQEATELLSETQESLAPYVRIAAAE